MYLFIASIWMASCGISELGEENAPRDPTQDPEHLAELGVAPQAPIFDQDGDGFSYHQDCRDHDPSVYPGADEICDGVDNDCDGSVDEDATDAGMWFVDSDGDGYGDARATPVLHCGPRNGYADNNLDCYDLDVSISPAAVEWCNGIDDNCDGSTDGDDAVDPVWYYADMDEDRFGQDDFAVQACDPPVGFVVDGGDCNDLDPLVNPGRAEVCNDGIDNNCDGGVNHCVVEGEMDLGGADAFYGGGASGDLLGNTLDGAGDLNGDGHNDVVVGAQLESSLVSEGGAAYVLFGPLTGAIAYTSTTRIRGDEEEAEVHTVVGTGDVDGDGVGDLGIGSWMAEDESGTIWLFGGPFMPGDLYSDDAEGSLHGAAPRNFAGAAVAGFEGLDGTADLLVGAVGESSIETWNGAVYLVDGPVTGSVRLAESKGTLFGEGSSTNFGGAMATGGDLDGDGVEDLLVGAYKDSQGGTSAGALYVLPLPFEGTAPVADAMTAKLVGETESRAGYSVDVVGDVNGDGYDDVVVGAPAASHLDPQAGAAYLVFGPVVGEGLLADAPLILLGEETGDDAGTAVAGAGDADADGLADLLIGAPGNSDYAGAAYLVVQSAEGMESLATLAQAKFVGEESGDMAGISVAGVGEMNQDGKDDLLVGAYRFGSVGWEGAAYLMSSRAQ